MTSLTHRSRKGSQAHAPRRAEGLRIVRLTLADVPVGQSLTDAEGWDTSNSDWKRLIGLEPDGAFKAVLGGRDVGTTASVVVDKVAWIHSVIVRKELRRQGVGMAMMRACLDFLQCRGVPCVKLDSNPGVEPFYEGLGFQREFRSWRYLRPEGTLETDATRLRPADWREVCVFDRVQTGLDRRRVLKAILEDYPNQSFLVREGGRVSGYLIVRSGTRWNSIGPCVVRDADVAIAERLFRAALSTSPDSKFRVCVGGYNVQACALRKTMGFFRESYCTRMFRGQRFQESPSAFAMTSAQKG